MQEEQVELHKLMRQDLSLVLNVNNVLARYWRLLLYDIDIRAPTWETLLIKWQLECVKRLGQAKAEQHKGNIPKRLAGETITWRFFCEGITVLDFEEVVFLIKTTREGKTQEFAIHIPKIYCDKDKCGELLRTLWDMINKGYPELASEKWSILMKRYSERYSFHEKTPGWVPGNLKRSLSQDVLTWNTFHKGLQLYAFDQIDMELIVKPKRRRAVIVQLRLC